MDKNIFKKLNRFFYLTLGLFVLLVFFQNCRMDFVATLSDRSASSSSILPIHGGSTVTPIVTSYSGNGGFYDGKLTFVALEPGFQCENQKSPKAILRFVNGQWYYTLNTEKQCGLIQNQAVQDVDYQEDRRFLMFNDLLFYQDTSLNNSGNFVTFAGQVKEFFVTPLADPNTSDATLGDGVCSNSLGLCSLRAAIEEANAALSPGINFYLIRVAQGTYNMSATLEISSPVFVGLFGDGPEKTIVVNNTSATGMVQVLANPKQVNKAFVSLQNLSFNQGIGLAGSGVSTSIRSLHIKNCMFDGHTGQNAVIFTGPGTSVLIEDTRIRGSQGDGIRILGDSVTIDNSEIINNAGAGIHFRGSVTNVHRNIRITKTTIARNFEGILVRNCHSNCLIENSTISENTSFGLSLVVTLNNLEGLVVRSSTITNGEVSTGTAIRLSRLDASIIPYHYLQLENSIITRGSSVQSNCIFSSNTSSIPQILSVNSIADDSSCNQEGNMTVVSNPLVGPLGDHGGFSLTHLLLPGSPAIDAGSDLLCPLSDQRGLRRLVSKTTSAQRCDVGAVEIQ